MTIAKDLKYRFQKFSVADKLIVVTTVIFVLHLLLERSYTSFFSYFRLTDALTDGLYKPWMFVTYAFFHNISNPIHIVVNMFVLHFIGNYFINLFSETKFLSIYFFGIVLGGLVFFLGAQIPFNQMIAQKTLYLVGASAALRALIIFLVMYSPNMEINIFNFRVALKYIGIIVVLFDVYLLFGKQPGSGLAHIGGSLAGCLYAMNIKSGSTMGSGLERFIVTISQLFKKKSHLKTVHKTRSEKLKVHKTDYQKNREKQEQIDEILEKISKSGYESLSKKDKQFLFDASKED
ncbi:MAG: rhomboid family intramembrane serine protease [Flavobacteriaceae bacterium]|nr:rhomboid family intramembrane serine protease [Flavobacteriaceae bacterium]